MVNDRVRGRAITFIPQDPSTLVQPRVPRRDADHGPDEVEVAARAPRAAGRGSTLSALSRASAIAPTATPCWTILRAVQIPEPARALRRLPHEFSGGQRQRLMIAMALLPRPDLIIADEPTTALDVTIQAQILRLLRELVKERGVSVLFTTHDLGTAHEICDRVVVMYAGQEMEAAPAEAFFARPGPPIHAPAARQRADRRRASSATSRARSRASSAPPSGCRFHPRCDYATAGMPGRPAGAPRARPRSRRALPPPRRRTSEREHLTGAVARGGGPHPALPGAQRLRPAHGLDPRGRRRLARGAAGRDARARRRERLRQVDPRQDGDGHPRPDQRRHPLRRPRDRPPGQATSGARSPRISSTSTRTPAPRSTRAGRSSTRCTSR